MILDLVWRCPDSALYGHPCPFSGIAVMPIYGIDYDSIITMEILMTNYMHAHLSELPTFRT